MSAQKVDFKRIDGYTRKEDKIDQFGITHFSVIEIRLNGEPSTEWAKIFEEPPLSEIEMRTHSMCPLSSKAKINHGLITFDSRPADIPTSLKVLDEYIQKVNDYYNQTLGL